MVSMGKRILARISGKRIFRYVAISLAGLFFLFLADGLGFLVRTDTGIYDFYFRLRGSVRPSSDIVIAAIDERSLERFGRWPISRHYYAALLEKVTGAGAVGFDVIMTEPSEGDAFLSDAIRRHGKVILPVYLDDDLDVISAIRSFAPLAIGHLHALPGIDGIVREAYHTINCRGEDIPSFSSAIYEVFSGRKLERRRRPPGKEDTLSGNIFQFDRMLINYYGPPGTFPYISMSDIIDGAYPSSFFSGKAVLVGFTAQGVVDRFMTPFSYNRDRMPGIEVHANLLNNLLKRSQIRLIDTRIKHLFVLLFSIVLFLVFIRNTEKFSAVTFLFSILLILASSFFLFTRFLFWSEPFIFCLASGFVFVTTYVYRLDEAARKLDSRYSAIVSLPSMGGRKEADDPVAERGLLTFLSADGINGRIQKLLSIEDRYEEKLQAVIDEKTMKLSEALGMVKTMSSEVVLRLTTAAESKDENTGRHISRIGLYVEELSRRLGMPGDFIEEISFSSAMHDVGKIGIPDRILLKPGSLTPAEFEVMKTHTVIGERILSGSAHPMIQMSARIALCHHERWNGTGYPEGLKGEAIPLEARIVMICDIYEALRSRRPYKTPLGHAESFRIITEGDGKISPSDFDPGILEAFIKLNMFFEEIFNEYSDDAV